MRKLTLLTGLAVTAFMAFSASAANAVVARDGMNIQVCPNIQVSGYNVTGGCLLEDMSGPFVLGYDQTVITDDCEASFDMRIDGSGNWRAVNNTALCSVPYYPVVRRECRDNSTGAVKPWSNGPTLSTVNICLEESIYNGQETWFAIGVSYAFDEVSSSLLGMTQWSPWQGIGDAQFTNNGATDEVLVTAS